MVSREKILIVDDMETFVKLEKMLLERSGYEIITARTGVEALKKIQADKPRLVFLDMIMPEMSGDAVCRFIKANKNLKHIPVVMVTTKSDELSRDRCLQAGCDDYMTKPVTQRDFFDKIKKFLNLEKRKHPRTRLRVSADCLQGELSYQNYSVDLSQSGVFIETPDPLPVGTDVIIRLSLPRQGAPILVKGSVVRTVPPSHPPEGVNSGMGVRFTNLSSEDVEKIKTFVAES
jgi:uncharacterized protein (TIGR02266 family)